MKAYSLKNWALLITATIFITSCQKHANDMDFSCSEDEVENSALGDDIDADVDAVSFSIVADDNTPDKKGDCKGRDHLPDCVTITESNKGFPKDITIDYGDGCVMIRGRVKKGKVIIHLSDEMINEGAVRTVTFNDFYVNERKIDGSRIVTNLGKNENGSFTFSREINMSIHTEIGTIVRSFSGEITWISGFDTDECGDNVFSVTGSGTVTGPWGTSARTILEPVIVDRPCGYKTAGIVQVERPNGKISTIDFGDGECDNLATITRNGEEHVINLDEFRVKMRKRIRERRR
ncbi:MAG: hypothetical protein IH946_02875 [Bacteroidetes bacterium]|nr:hypothetical protein [Bacteroidota bacterium]